MSKTGKPRQLPLLTGHKIKATMEDAASTARWTPLRTPPDASGQREQVVLQRPAPANPKGANMGHRGGAGLALAVWGLVLVGVEAGDLQAPRPCLLSHYRWLDPRALAAVRTLKDAYEEEALGSTPRSCSFRSRGTPPPPWSCARLRRVARGIADAQAVLSSLRSPRSEPFPGAGPTLELLAAVRRDLSACLDLGRPGSSRKLLRTPRRPPKRDTRRTESPGCREAKVVFSLLRLLTWDLRLVAHSGPCL